MSRSIISEIRRNHIYELLRKGRRMDDRGPHDLRKITVETGVIDTAEGSARVRYGDTEVIAGLKMAIGTPFPDTPDKGVLTTGMELIPMAHPDFEAGPPGSDAIELARVVDRGIRESGMVDVDKLCITPGEEVWMCFIDIYAINHDGNLFDAAALAVVSSLKTATVPAAEYGKGEDFPLPVTCLPITVTVAKIENTLIVDPTFDEEIISSARLTVTTDENGDIRAMQKGKSGALTVDEIGQIVDLASEKGEEIRRLIR
ncbi:MAG: exosome complex component [Candidatus Methanomethylophilaceae archaeon]|nr:exosome complex component [Candidatus Methanomethylophilaceae archaeon]MDI3541701.1 exosome complex component [Candidatus Methanomethylophilaceae archaeon]